MVGRKDDVVRHESAASSARCVAADREWARVGSGERLEVRYSDEHQIACVCHLPRRNVQAERSGQRRTTWTLRDHCYRHRATRARDPSARSERAIGSACPRHPDVTTSSTSCSPKESSTPRAGWRAAPRSWATLENQV